MTPCFLFSGTNVPFLQLFLVYQSFQTSYLPGHWALHALVCQCPFLPSLLWCGLTKPGSEYLSWQPCFAVGSYWVKKPPPPQGLFKGSWVSQTRDTDSLNPVQMFIVIFTGFHLVSFHPVEILSPASKTSSLIAYLSSGYSHPVGSFFLSFFLVFGHAMQHVGS